LLLSRVPESEGSPTPATRTCRRGPRLRGTQHLEGANLDEKPVTTAKNQLYYGDNYEVLQRYLKDESVDLVYLDPPCPLRLCSGQAFVPLTP
jgi:hypothetical protein